MNQQSQCINDVSEVLSRQYGIFKLNTYFAKYVAPISYSSLVRESDINILRLVIKLLLTQSICDVSRVFFAVLSNEIFLY